MHVMSCERRKAIVDITYSDIQARGTIRDTDRPASSSHCKRDCSDKMDLPPVALSTALSSFSFIIHHLQGQPPPRFPIEI
jgi:hypothetical protein